MKKWYYLHPDYKEDLANRVSDMKVLYCRKVIFGINGAELIRQALAKNVVFKDGELLVKIDLLPLIANKKWSYIHNCLGRERETKSADQLSNFAFCGLNNDVEFEIPLLDDIVLIFLKQKDKTRAEKLLTSFSANSSKSWCNCAKLWSFFFNNSEKTKLCLEKAEKCLHWGSSDLVECAESWMRIFNDDDIARKCLSTAENIAESAPSRLNCAKGWKTLFNDDEKALNCLQTAEEQEKEITEFDAIKGNFAETWAILFNDLNRGRQCLEEAEILVNDEFDWMSHAYSWKNIFNESSRARLCLEKATEQTNSVYCLIYILQDWKILFDDNSEVRKCLEKAETIATFSSDWELCAEYWHMIANDSIRARECLIKAEKVLSNVEGLKSCARCWIEIFNDTERAKRCLEEANL